MSSAVFSEFMPHQLALAIQSNASTFSSDSGGFHRSDMLIVEGVFQHDRGRDSPPIHLSPSQWAQDVTHSDSDESSELLHVLAQVNYRPTRCSLVLLRGEVTQ